MQQINSEAIYKHLPYEEFIPFLQQAFTEDYTVPQRMHQQFDNGVADTPSTLLLMPAWRDGNYLGVKSIILSPHNSRFDLPTLQGVYLLFDAKNGTPLASYDAGAITARRTAAKSALASSFLSRENSNSLLMVGTGTLSAELIRAHATVRPVEEVIIWEHTPGKGETVIDRLHNLELNFSVTCNLEEVVPEVDIISVATMSIDPLIQGDWLHEGQHIDTVGAYRTDMREADDKVLRRSEIYIDHNDAFEETGDLSVPLEEGVIGKDDVKGTLFELCRKEKSGRLSSEEITFFKSTGHALEDLSAALFVYQQLELSDN